MGGQHSDNSCTVSMNTSLCNEVFDSKGIFTPCNGKSQCEHEVMIHRDFRKCKNITTAQVKYDCVNNNSTLDMCTDVSLERNTSSSVIYLKSPGFPNSLASEKECTCIVETEGNFIRLQILDLSFFYNDSEIDDPSFIAKNADMTLWDTGKERNLLCPSCNFYKRQKVNIAQGQKHSQLFYNNKNQSQQNLWIEITGHPYKLMTVECNANISERNKITLPQTTTSSLPSSSPVTTEIISSNKETSPSERTSPTTEVSSPSESAITTSGQTASVNLEENETDYKNFAIAFAVVAAILFILLITIIVVWFVRRHRKKSRSSSKNINDVTIEENHEQSNQNDGLYEIADEQTTGVQTSTVPTSGRISQERNYVNSTEVNDQQLSADIICNGDYVNSGQDVQLNDYEKLDPPAATVSQNTYEKLTVL